MPIQQLLEPNIRYVWSWRQGSGPAAPCYPYTELTASYFGNYPKYYKQYNSPEHRAKPDPLTDTAQALQFTRRIKPSIIEPFLDFSTSAYCNGSYGTMNYYKQGRNIIYAETDVINEPDWSAKVLQEVAKEYVNLGSSLAEYRETGKMFAQFAETTHKVWHYFRNSKRGKFFLDNFGKLTPCSVPAAELAYSFGIAPLAEDLFSAAESLKLRLGQPILRKISTQSRTNTTRDIRSTPHSLSVHSYSVEKEMVSDRCKLHIPLNPLGPMNFNFGNPTNWVWELIPFSFVVDWGIPIGQWLEDIDTLKSIGNISGTRTRKIQKVVTYRYRIQRQSGAWYTNASNGKVSYKSHQRFLVNSLPFPKLPRWNPSPTYHKVYRAVSLLIAVNQPCRKYSGRPRRRSSR